MIWHGISINAARYVANSIRNNVRFSALWLSASGPVAGASNALQALRLQATEAITMYAQLLTRSPTGAFSAWTPVLSCAIRFSWSQRSLAWKTIWSAGVVRSLVI